MKIALTGATGLIGRRLVAALAQHRELRLLGRDTERLRSLAGDVVAWDLATGGDPHALRDVDTLVHAAAYIPAAMGASTEAERCWQINAYGTHILVEAAIRAGVRHIVYVSSGNVYWPLEREVSEADLIYPSPRAPYYLSSKLCGELFADHLARAATVDFAIARPASVYGPGMSGGLVATFVQHALSGKALTVQNGGHYRSDLVFVDDVVAGLVALIDRRATGPFNLGSGTSTSVLELARALVELLGRDEGALDVQPALTPGASGFAALDITRARRELDYAPHDIRAGLAAMLEQRP